MPPPDRRARLLHVIHRLGDGGADRTLVRVADGLVDRFDQAILCVAGGGSGYGSRPDGVCVIEPAGEPATLSETIDALSAAGAWPCDLVHGWVSSGTVTAATLAAVLGCPLVLRQPTNIERELETSRAYLEPQLPALSRAFGVADCVVLPSPALLPGTARVYGPCRTAIIPNAAPPVPPSGSSGSMRPDGRLVVAMAGRLVAQKNPVAVVEALIGVLGRVSWQLWIFGDGELRSAIEDRLTSEVLKERVQFMGFRPDWLALADDIDIFVQATRFEGMSNTLLEAAAAGLPIITTDIPENRFVLSDEACVLVPPDDGIALRDALVSLAASPARRAALGDAARRGVRRFSVQAMVEAYDRHYSALLDMERTACAA